MKYAGIGSRSTPQDVCEVLARWGERAARAGWILRSDGAPGADTAFERGCDAAGGLKEIFLPWARFQENPSPFTRPTEAAIRMAAGAHPAFGMLKPAERLLHGRNAHQVFGPNLDDPIAMVLCWTEDGCESEAARTPATGGTGTGITLASRAGIPVFNLRNPDAERRLLAWLDARAAEDEASVDAKPRAR
jgi:hypothetical protein